MVVQSGLFRRRCGLGWFAGLQRGEATGRNFEMELLRTK